MHDIYHFIEEGSFGYVHTTIFKKKIKAGALPMHLRRKQASSATVKYGLLRLSYEISLQNKVNGSQLLLQDYKRKSENLSTSIRGY